MRLYFRKLMKFKNKVKKKNISRKVVITFLASFGQSILKIKINWRKKMTAQPIAIPNQ